MVCQIAHCHGSMAWWHRRLHGPPGRKHYHSALWKRLHDPGPRRTCIVFKPNSVVGHIMVFTLRSGFISCPILYHFFKILPACYRFRETSIPSLPLVPHWTTRVANVLAAHFSSRHRDRPRGPCEKSWSNEACNPMAKLHIRYIIITQWLPTVIVARRKVKVL